MKKLACCLAFVILLTVLMIPGATASADGITWSVDGNVMTVTGTGTIGPYNYASSNSSATTTSPCESYRDVVTSLVVGEGISYIGNLAFRELTKLEEITLPSTLTGYSLGDNEATVYSAFDFYQGVLQRINWGGTTDQWIRLQNRWGSWDYSPATDDSRNLVRSSPTIYVNGAPLTEIVLTADSPNLARYAMGNCQTLTTLTVEDDYQGSIGRFAFYNCPNLKTITFEGDAPALDSYAFSGITATVYYTANDSWIGKTQGYGGELTWVDQGGILSSGTCGDALSWSMLSDGTLSITGTGAMTDFVSSVDVPWYDHIADISAVSVGSGVTSIGNFAFYDCDSLKSVMIPEGMTRIGEKAFSYCRSLPSITIPAGVTIIGNNAFATCDSLTSVTIPDSVTSIGDFAFQSCGSLTSVTIPEGVTSIGDRAFQFCSGLTSITLPKSMTSIGEGVFYCCSGLTDVYYPGTQAQWDEISVGSYNDSLANATLHCLRLIEVAETGHGTVSVTIDGEPAEVSLDGAVVTLSITPDEYCELKSLSVTADGEEVPVTDGQFIMPNADVTVTAVFDRAIVASGECGAQGDNLTWTLYDDGELVISGEGEMADYPSGGAAPWYDHRSNITTVTIESGVMSIGDCSFVNCNITDVSLPTA